MKLKIVCLLLGSILPLSFTNALNLNPAQRSFSDSDYDKNLITKIGEPVHEMVTRDARELFWKKCDENNNIKLLCGLEHKHPATINDSIIRGVWWNDDPGQDLYRLRQIEWIMDMREAKKRARDPKYTIDSKYYTVYRSHYGDMQFLHAMASEEDELSRDTKEKMYLWLEFVYRIALGEIKHDDKFSEINLAISNHYFPNKQDWEIFWELQPRYHLKKRALDFKLHGLGSFLHVIQDSYSKAHVKRDYSKTSDCPAGGVVSFNSYINQDDKKHKNEDTLETLKQNNFNGFGPVEASAEIMYLLNSNADWDNEVVPYLDQNIFCLTEPDSEASHGGYN